LNKGWRSSGIRCWGNQSGGTSGEARRRRIDDLHVAKTPASIERKCTVLRITSPAKGNRWRGTLLCKTCSRRRQQAHTASIRRPQTRDWMRSHLLRSRVLSNLAKRVGIDPDTWVRIRNSASHRCERHQSLVCGRRNRCRCAAVVFACCTFASRVPLHAIAFGGTGDPQTVHFRSMGGRRLRHVEIVDSPTPCFRR